MKVKKSAFISVRVADDIKAKLVTMAEQQERPVSWIVCKILEAYFAERSQEQ